jgi:hypothetical protein
MPITTSRMPAGQAGCRTASTMTSTPCQLVSPPKKTTNGSGGALSIGRNRSVFAAFGTTETRSCPVAARSQSASSLATGNRCRERRYCDT